VYVNVPFVLLGGREIGGTLVKTKEGTVQVDRFHLLIVEDSATIRHAYASMLGEKYQLTFAEDALTALRLVATVQPDVIVLDINIKDSAPRPSASGGKPAKKMDGLDICAAIKRSPFKHTPVIMLTSRDGIIDKVRGKLARADRYLTKPINESVLQRELREFLYDRIVRNRMLNLNRVYGGAEQSRDDVGRA
jgi:twitching motility two-component system response regulator PilG